MPRPKKTEPDPIQEAAQRGPMKYITYTVEVEGITELLGGMPKSEKLIEGMMSSKEVRLRAKALGRDPERIIAENIAAMGLDKTPPETEALEEALDEEKMSCGFRASSDGHLCLGAHQIRSMLVDCATTLKYSRQYQGLKDLLTRGLQAIDPTLAKRQGVDASLLRILGEKGPVSQPTGERTWGSQISDRMGRRAILRRYDFVFPWKLAFRVRFPATGVMTRLIWEDLWRMAEVQGLGAARPRGYGKFRVKENQAAE